MRTIQLLLLLPLSLLLTGAVYGEEEVMDLNPLSEKDLSYFKIEGEGAWEIDDKTDDIDTLIVSPRAKQDSSLLFVKRKFKHGFLVSMRMSCGSRNKGLEVYVVPNEGDRISVPLPKRTLSRKGWQKFMLKVEDGDASAKIGDEWGDSVEVPKDEEVTFAFKLLKGSQAAFKKMKVKFLVVAEAQAQAEEGYVSIFDGKTLDGWMTSSWRESRRPVENGCINPRKCGGYLMIHKEMWSDFVL